MTMAEDISVRRSILIEWLEDWRECETCGTQSALGARVAVDGAPCLSLVPRASCTAPVSWTEEEVYVAVLKELGFDTVSVAASPLTAPE